MAVVCKYGQQVLMTWPFVCPMFHQYDLLGDGPFVSEYVQQVLAVSAAATRYSCRIPKLQAPMLSCSPSTGYCYSKGRQQVVGVVFVCTCNGDPIQQMLCARCVLSKPSRDPADMSVSPPAYIISCSCADPYRHGTLGVHQTSPAASPTPPRQDPCCPL